MDRDPVLERDLEWFRGKLEQLDDPELPPSLTAEALLARCAPWLGRTVR